jgi:hypothetical protein
MSDTNETVELPQPTKRVSDDWLAIICATLLLFVSFAAVWSAQPSSSDSDTAVKRVSPLKGWVAKPAKWT